MLDKSRYSRKLSRRQRRKGMPISSPPAILQRAKAQPSKPVVALKVAAPAATVPTLTSTKYPYMIPELKRIGILTGIIVVILVVLFLVLS